MVLGSPSSLPPKAWGSGPDAPWHIEGNAVMFMENLLHRLISSPQHPWQ